VNEALLAILSETTRGRAAIATMKYSGFYFSMVLIPIILSAAPAVDGDRRINRTDTSRNLGTNKTDRRADRYSCHDTSLPDDLLGIRDREPNYCKSRYSERASQIVLLDIFRCSDSILKVISESAFSE
jgi:hypothetical protein